MTAKACCKTSTGRIGLLGYFPTYLLGSVLSIQIWERVRAALAGSRRRRSSAATSPRCTIGSARTSTRSGAS